MHQMYSKLTLSFKLSWMMAEEENWQSLVISLAINNFTLVPAFRSTWVSTYHYYRPVKKSHDRIGDTVYSVTRTDLKIKIKQLFSFNFHKPDNFSPVPPAHCSYPPDLCLQYEVFDLHYEDVYPVVVSVKIRVWVGVRVS